MQFRVVSRICPKERLPLPDHHLCKGFWWETTSLWTPGLMLGCFLQQHEASPDSSNLCGWLRPLWPRPIPNHLATCSLVCSSLCYRKQETISFWSKECKEGVPGKSCLLRERLARFAHGLLKLFLFSLSYIFKILFYCCFFLLQKRSKIIVENTDKKKKKKERKKNINHYSTNPEITILNSLVFSLSIFFWIYVYIYTHMYICTYTCKNSIYYKMFSVTINTFLSHNF